MSDASNIDLRKFQDGGEGEESVKNIFGKIISGQEGYETVVDKNKLVRKCECGKVLDEEKFCPECGKSVGNESS